MIAKLSVAFCSHSYITYEAVECGFLNTIPDLQHYVIQKFPKTDGFICISLCNNIKKGPHLVLFGGSVEEMFGRAPSTFLFCELSLIKYLNGLNAIQVVTGQFSHLNFTSFYSSECFFNIF